MKFKEFFVYLALVLLLVMCSKTDTPKPKQERLCLGDLVFGTIYNEIGEPKFFVMDDEFKYIIEKETMMDLKNKQLSGMDSCIDLKVKYLIKK